MTVFLSLSVFKEIVHIMLFHFILTYYVALCRSTGHRTTPCRTPSSFWSSRLWWLWVESSSSTCLSLFHTCCVSSCTTTALGEVLQWRWVQHGAIQTTKSVILLYDSGQTMHYILLIFMSSKVQFVIRVHWVYWPAELKTVTVPPEMIFSSINAQSENTEMQRILS